MTIKKSLLTIILLLNLMIAYFLVMDIIKAWHHKHQLVEEQEANIAMTDLLKAADHWAVERGVTNAALSANTPVPEARKQIILERRAKAKHFYEDALKHIKILNQEMDKDNPLYKLVGETTEKMKQSYVRIEELRNQVDQALAVYKHERNASLAQQWVPSMSSLIITSQDLRFVLTEDALQIDPELGREAELRHFGWIMSEYAGRERAIIGGLIASNQPLSKAKLKTLSEYRGRVEEGWNLAKKLGYTSNEAVHNAMAKTQKIFFDDYNPLRESIYQAGMRERSGFEDPSQPIYPVSSKDWIAAATKAIDSINILQDASIDETKIHMQHMEDKVTQEIIFEVILLIVTLAISGSAFYVVLFKVTYPLKKMTESMNQLAENNTNIEIPCIGQKDEMGIMASAVQVFKDNAIERQKLEEQQKQAELLAEEEKKKAMKHLADSFEQQVHGIIQAVASSATELAQTAEHMSKLISHSGEITQNATSSATEATANVHSVASAAEEMSATVSEISSQVHRSNELVSVSVEKVDGADAHAQALSEASGKVKEVVELIADIAGQINLLALNATIESARAGEAGKGFAVVAGEVKNLASQTDKSIQEIEKVIGEMSLVSEDIVGALDAIKQSVNDISETAGGVASAVEQQSATTNEIASNMQSAAVGTQNISDNLKDISEGSTKSQSASNQVLSAAQELSKQAETLEQEVQNFLSEVRAA